jgi:hypothetical protein
MILNEERVKHIADKVRSLPDAVLADIGFERVMGCEVVAIDPGITPIVSHPNESHAIAHDRKRKQQTGPKPSIVLAEQRVDGENKQTLVQVIRRRPVEVPAFEAVARIVRETPGLGAKEIRNRLGGISDERWSKARMRAKDAGLIKKLGSTNKATYWPVAAQ